MVDFCLQGESGMNAVQLAQKNFISVFFMLSSRQRGGSLAVHRIISLYISILMFAITGDTWDPMVALCDGNMYVCLLELEVGGLAAQLLQMSDLWR